MLTRADLQAAGKKTGPVCEEGGCCITPSGDFYNVERGNPLPYKLPIEKLREIGMVRETWQLEIISDPASNAKIEHPMLRSDGTAFPNLLAAGGAARGVSGNAVWGYLSGNGLLSAVAGGHIAAQTAQQLVAQAPIKDTSA